MAHCDAYGDNVEHCEDELDDHPRVYLCSWGDHDESHDDWETLRGLKRICAYGAWHEQVAKSYYATVGLSDDDSLSGGSTETDESTETGEPSESEDEDELSDVGETDEESSGSVSESGDEDNRGGGQDAVLSGVLGTGVGTGQPQDMS